MKHPHFCLIGTLLVFLFSAPFTAYAGTPVIMDDGDSGHTFTGSWTRVTGSADSYNGDWHYETSAGSKSTWEFTGLSPGIYVVAVRWHTQGNLSTDAPFTVFNGGASLETVSYNQRAAPDDFNYDGYSWEYMGSGYVITETSIKVELDEGNAYDVADAVYIEHVADIVGCEETNNSITGTVYSDEGTTPVANASVALKINGQSQICTVEADAAGGYTATGFTLTGGLLVNIYTAGNPEKATTVVFASGNTMTGVDLYQDRLILYNGSGSGVMDNDDLYLVRDSTGTGTSKIYSSTGALTMENHTELFIRGGTTFQPGDAINTFDIQVDGTLTLAANTGVVLGSWDSSSGAFTTTGVVKLSGSGSRTVTATDDSFSSLTIGLGDPAIENGLVAWWKLEEGSGTAALDSTTNGNHATLRGTSGDEWVTTVADTLSGVSSYSLDLDGANDYLDTDAVLSGIGSDNSVTMSAWFNVETKNTYDYLLSSDPSGIQGMLISGAAGSPITYIWEGGSDEYNGQGVAFSTGQWYFNAVTIASGKAIVYLHDGTTLSSWTNTKTHNAKSMNVVWDIGIDSNDSTREWNGNVDDIRIYDRTLTEAEIEDLADGYGGGSGVYVLGVALDVDSDLTIVASELDAAGSNYTITVGGDWINKVGTGGFIRQSGTVTFDGSGTQTISGTTIFHNLTRSETTAKTLQFDPDGVTTVTGALTLQGAASNLLTITSSIATESGALILYGYGGTQTLKYLDVSSINSRGGAEMTCDTGCTDSGNTQNWDFTEAPAGGGGGNQFFFFW